MSDKPQDPAQESIDQQEHHADSYDGQKGYGVDYKEGRYRSEELQQMPPGGRSGSYETGNEGGYGTNQPTPAGTGDTPAELPPDPEAQQGQGGQ